MAKIPKITLATRNPVAGEFMFRFLCLSVGLSVKIGALYSALLRKDAACTTIPTIATPMNTIVDPDGGRTIAHWIKCAPMSEETTMRAQSNKVSRRIATITPPTTKMTVEYWTE